ncbi:MAG: TetR/AcrR family transcriptional regulator [Caldilineaceae bacterium]|nr:TetR/AcrR family transcriptional regulator [Caldilineaceae bacterium]
MTTIDRRTVRTRALLRNALVNWMLEKEYDDISVQDITDRANLGRATFYLHYKDKDDLLLSMLDELHDELLARIHQQIRSQGFDGPPPIQLVFEHAAENSDLYKVVLSGAGKTAILTRTRDTIVSMLQKFVTAVGKAPQIPVEVTAVYLAGAQMHLIGWWLENDLPYSVEEMVRMYHLLTVYGVMPMLGIHDPKWGPDADFVGNLLKNGDNAQT